MIDEKHWGEKKPPAKKDAQPPNSGKPEKHIAVHENKIYYYAGVNRESAAELNKKIGELETKCLTLCHNLDLEKPPTLKVLINSGGGSITAGISSMDTILRCKVPVETYVDGFCASAATFLSVVASHRLMSRNSYMLIHQLSTNFWGKYSEFEDEKQNLDLNFGRNGVIGIKSDMSSVNQLLDKLLLRNVLEFSITFTMLPPIE